MENIFNLNRFWLLVRKHASENRKLFLISLLLMVIPALLLKLIYGYSSSTGSFFLYIIFLVLFGMIYTGMFFKEWTHKSRATSLILLPSTPLEKIILVLFYTIFVFIPVYSFVFYYSNVALFTPSYHSLHFSFKIQYDNHSLVYALVLRVLLPYIFFQSLFLLCSIWFKKWQIVITLSAVVFIIIAANLWNYHYIKGLTGGASALNGSQWCLFPFNVRYKNGGSYQIITSNLITDINILVYIIMTVLFYWASYFKLKEKEI